MNLDNKKVIFIIGPTAIGKTKLSIDLAKLFSCEIISCDSRQFYKELKIGSAPPNKLELTKIKHHFIQNLSVEEDYSAGQFEIDAIELIKKIHEKTNLVLMVGGSGLYIDAICKGLDKTPKISKKIRKEINEEYKNKGLIWLQEKVKKIDPELYFNNNCNNPQRLLRTLELFSQTGKNLSSFQTKKTKKRPFKIIKIGLNTNRKILYNRINKRVDDMIEKGLLKEAHSLINYQHKNALQTVGYKEIFKFLENKFSFEEAINAIKKNTRRFAKRQLTWFRKDKEIKWFEPNELNEIKKFISKS
tara:strand:- start:10254 stop:11159 length:906 start_codon:yes stop_codon:yes gene_type:complete